ELELRGQGRGDGGEGAQGPRAGGGISIEEHPAHGVTEAVQVHGPGVAKDEVDRGGEGALGVVIEAPGAAEARWSDRHPDPSELEHVDIEAATPYGAGDRVALVEVEVQAVSSKPVQHEHRAVTAFAFGRKKMHRQRPVVGGAGAQDLGCYHS